MDSKVIVFSFRIAGSGGNGGIMVPKRKDNRTETSIDFATRPSTYLDENNEERENPPHKPVPPTALHPAFEVRDIIDSRTEVN
jgi:hypothetical protein